jgi:hypothetical protein
MRNALLKQWLQNLNKSQTSDLIISEPQAPIKGYYPTQFM